MNSRSKYKGREKNKRERIGNAQKEKKNKNFRIKKHIKIFELIIITCSVVVVMRMMRE